MQVDGILKDPPPVGQTEQQATDARTVRVSVLGGLYMLVLIAAAVMRLANLGRFPLSPVEATEALAAWRYLQPGTLAVEVGSPAYFTLTSLLMPLLGVSDGVARLVPALFGIALVALPWLMQRQLSRAGVLAAAALLAASPLNSALARTVGGDAIALSALLLLATSVLNMHDDRTNSRWTYAFAFAFSLGVCSSPLFYSGLLALVPAWLIARSIAGQPFWNARPSAATVRNALLGSLVLFIMLSTRFLTYPAGLGDAAQLLGRWFAQFGLSGGLLSTLAPFALLGRYEIALLLLGIVAFAWAYWRTNMPRIWLTFWILTTFVVMLLQSTYAVNAVLVTLPGYLLIGHFSGYQWRTGTNRATAILTGMLLLAGAILLVNMTRYLRVSIYEPDVSNLWLAVFTLVATALVLYYFWSMTDASLGTAAWTAAFIILMVYQWGTAWNLAHRAINDPRERWVTMGSDDELPILLETLTDLARQATNSDNGLQLLSAVDTPVLEWYLRDFRRATIGQTVPPQATHQVIISSAAAQEPQFGADYVGSDFGLLRTGATQVLDNGTPLADLLRWWLFHETSAGMIEERVILWVRADLVQPER